MRSRNKTAAIKAVSIEGCDRPLVCVLVSSFRKASSKVAVRWCGNISVDRMSYNWIRREYNAECSLSSIRFIFWRYD